MIKEVSNKSLEYPICCIFEYLKQIKLNTCGSVEYKTDPRWHIKCAKREIEVSLSSLSTSLCALLSCVVNQDGSLNVTSEKFCMRFQSPLSLHITLCSVLLCGSFFWKTTPHAQYSKRKVHDFTHVWMNISQCKNLTLLFTRELTFSQNGQQAQPQPQQWWQQQWELHFWSQQWGHLNCLELEETNLTSLQQVKVRKFQDCHKKHPAYDKTAVLIPFWLYDPWGWQCHFDSGSNGNVHWKSAPSSGCCVSLRMAIVDSVMLLVTTSVAPLTDTMLVPMLIASQTGKYVWLEKKTLWRKTPEAKLLFTCPSQISLWYLRFCFSIASLKANSETTAVEATDLVQDTEEFARWYFQHTWAFSSTQLLYTGTLATTSRVTHISTGWWLVVCNSWSGLGGGAGHWKDLGSEYSGCFVINPGKTSCCLVL